MKSRRPLGRASVLRLTGVVVAAALCSPGSASAATVDHLTWSPSPVATAGSLGVGGSTTVTVTAYDSGGNTVAGPLIYLSLGRDAGSSASASSPACVSAVDPSGAVGPQPAPCQADASGSIQVSYSSSGEPAPSSGSDNLFASSDGHGASLGTDSYTYTVGPPTATITTPPDGATYDEGQVIDASYSCADAAGGPGISSCVGSVANGAAIDTSTVGPYTFTVTATSSDGQTATRTDSYSVIGPPSATITTPADGATYSLNQVIDASYSCADAAGGPGPPAAAGSLTTRPGTGVGARFRDSGVRR